MFNRNFHQWRSFAKEAYDFTSTIFKAYCAIQVTREYLFNFAYIMGPSMLPTFDLTGDMVVVDALSRRQGKLGLGDVVLVRSPENPRKIVTKRLIGMEGDSISFNADPRNTDKWQSIVVPKGHVWVQGDNVYDSRDSRHFGAVPYALLQGRVVWRMSIYGSAGKIVS
ncbi:hypothetical protein V2J09_019280 [Rumex salicifolius]